MARVELYAVLDRYLAALEARDPARLAWHARAKTSENNVVLDPGDGLWGTITGRGGYDLRFADETTGQVGFFGSVVETRDESPLTLRIGVRDASSMRSRRWSCARPTQASVSRRRATQRSL
jgi:hypothetical protein